MRLLAWVKESASPAKRHPWALQTSAPSALQNALLEFLKTYTHTHTPKAPNADPPNCKLRRDRHIMVFSLQPLKLDQACANPKLVWIGFWIRGGACKTKGHSMHVSGYLDCSSILLPPPHRLNVTTVAGCACTAEGTDSPQ